MGRERSGRRKSARIRQIAVRAALIGLPLLLLGLGAWAFVRGIQRMFDTTVYRVTSVERVAQVTGLVFPSGCRLVDGRVHPPGSMAASGLWAVVRMPRQGVEGFLHQPWLDHGAPAGDQQLYLGMMLPDDSARQQYQRQSDAVRHPIGASGGEMYGRGGAVEVRIDPEASPEPVVYVNWHTD